MQRQFSLRPSRYLTAILLAAHTAGLVAIACADLPLQIQIALALLVLFSLGYHVWHDAWLASLSSASTLVLDENQITITTRDGKRVDGRILPDSLVTPWLTVLKVLPPDARIARSTLILPDSMDEESFRRLRVLLKWNNAKAA